MLGNGCASSQSKIVLYCIFLLLCNRGGIMSFAFFISAFLCGWCCSIGICIVYAGVNRKTWRGLKGAEADFEKLCSEYNETEQAKQDDPFARIRSIEWEPKTREVVELKYEEC